MADEKRHTTFMIVKTLIIVFYAIFCSYGIAMKMLWEDVNNLVNSAYGNFFLMRADF